MSYREMAQVYDRLMADAPYDRWVDFTKTMIQRYHHEASSLLDLGCGTGEITHRLFREGYEMTGVDLSDDMLAMAQQKNTLAPIQWLKQDITNLAGLGGFDCVISYCDVMNYMTGENSLKAALTNAYEALGNRGLFLFDVHSIDHIQNDMIGATFAEVYDDLSYIWFCDPGDSEHSLIHDLTFFIQSGDQFARFDEQHYQKGYTRSSITKLVEDIGFTVKQISADFHSEPSDTGERLFFVCQKL